MRGPKARRPMPALVPALVPVLLLGAVLVMAPTPPHTAQAATLATAGTGPEHPNHHH